MLANLLFQLVESFLTSESHSQTAKGAALMTVRTEGRDAISEKVHTIEQLEVKKS